MISKFIRRIRGTQTVDELLSQFTDTAARLQSVASSEYDRHEELLTEASSAYQAALRADNVADRLVMLVEG